MTSEEWLIGFGIVPDQTIIDGLDEALKEQRERCALAADKAVGGDQFLPFTHAAVRNACLNAVDDES